MSDTVNEKQRCLNTSWQRQLCSAFNVLLAECQLKCCKARLHSDMHQSKASRMGYYEAF